MNISLSAGRLQRHISARFAPINCNMAAVGCFDASTALMLYVPYTPPAGFHSLESGEADNLTGEPEFSGLNAMFNDFVLLV